MRTAKAEFYFFLSPTSWCSRHRLRPGRPPRRRARCHRGLPLLVTADGQPSPSLSPPGAPPSPHRRAAAFAPRPPSSPRKRSPSSSPPLRAHGARLLPQRPPLHRRALRPILGRRRARPPDPPRRKKILLFPAILATRSDDDPPPSPLSRRSAPCSPPTGPPEPPSSRQALRFAARFSSASPPSSRPRRPLLALLRFRDVHYHFSASSTSPRAKVDGTQGSCPGKVGDDSGVRSKEPYRRPDSFCRDRRRLRARSAGAEAAGQL